MAESEDEQEWPNQYIMDAVSSTDEWAGTKRRKVEEGRREQDITKLEDKSAYDVFLSFRRYSSRNFADSLYHRLQADGILVFREEGILGTSKMLPRSVYSSKIYVPIFSADYAYSPWSLEKLALMVERTSRSGGKKEILPIFYDVERSDVQLEKESLFRELLDTHKQSLGDEKAEQWKKALVDAGKKGWELSSYKGEEELIASIVGQISLKLKAEQNYVPEDPFAGAHPMSFYRTSELQDSQKSEIMRLLALEVNDVRIVGIHGRDGIGKTTLAKITYDQISFCFDACSFLAEIEETVQQPGGVQYLQTKLIFDILKREYEVASAFKGIRFLKELFRNVKVLIVLDGLEREALLREFVGAKLDWFGSGSRIIVTSKQKSVLQGFVDRGLAHTYDVIPMDDDLAFSFFWRYASGYSDELRSYVDIAKKIVKAARGLPLLLKIFGSFLANKGKQVWIEFLDLLEQCQEDCQQILSTIYEALDQMQKQMYLDIACFLPHVDWKVASHMWHHYDRPNNVIKVLRRMFLVNTEENKIGMHSMLRCLAREIIRKGFHSPRTGVGLYISATAQDTNKGKKTPDHLKTEVAGFEILPSTTFLSLGRANIGGQFADALLNVRWLHWQGCPRDAISIHLGKNENLVILDLSWSKVTESWGGWKGIKMRRLKVLNLTGCADLLVTPSFSCCPNLERLILMRCSRLVNLDPSINGLKLLVTLNLKFCTELNMLPVKMDGMRSLRELLIDGTSIRELPESIGKLVRLQILSATNCFSLVRIPASICALKVLSVLAMDNAKVLELHESIGDLWLLRRLSLRDCRGLGMLPESIGELAFLVELDISGTGILRLPQSIKNVWRLKILKMDFCFIREFPRSIGWLRNLEEVHASWCRNLGGVIPSSISELHRLRELRLRGTAIYSLPSEMHWLSSLKTLDLLHCDNIKELPRLPSSLVNLYVNPGLTRNV